MIVTRPLQAWDRPNFQVAIEAFLAGRQAELLGLATFPGIEIGLAELARGGEMFGAGISGAPPGTAGRHSAPHAPRRGRGVL